MSQEGTFVVNKILSLPKLLNYSQRNFLFSKRKVKSVYSHVCSQLPFLHMAPAQLLGSDDVFFRSRLKYAEKQSARLCKSQMPNYKFPLVDKTCALGIWNLSSIKDSTASDVQFQSRHGSPQTHLPLDCQCSIKTTRSDISLLFRNSCGGR